ncbi:MAG: hypothetical protein IPM64_17440 [Phycisphaerales bacterium]|nr:hypothetical protein [Phycisphaerales bacterium]
MADFSATLIGARVSLATAVVAGMAAVGQQVPVEDAMWGSVKLLHVIMGSVGAAITLSVVQEWGWRKVVMTLFTGLGSAAFGTPFALHYFTPPAQLMHIGESGYAALLGACGVYLIPGMHNAARAFAANPFGFVDWVRGRGAPPPPPAPPPGGGPL